MANSIEKIVSRFLWLGCDELRKVHNVCWDFVIRPKSEGGLGLGLILNKNKALVVKWFKDMVWKRQLCENMLLLLLIEEMVACRFLEIIIILIKGFGVAS